MNKQTTNLILVGVGVFVLFKIWQSKAKVVSTATAQQQPGVAPGNNSSTGTNWGQTIASLYSGISSIFSGNSTSNASNPPAGATAPTVIAPPSTDLGVDPGFELQLPSSSGG